MSFLVRASPSQVQSQRPRLEHANRVFRAPPLSTRPFSIIILFYAMIWLLCAPLASSLYSLGVQNLADPGAATASAATAGNTSLRKGDREGIDATPAVTSSSPPTQPSSQKAEAEAVPAKASGGASPPPSPALSNGSSNGNGNGNSDNLGPAAGNTAIAATGKATGTGTGTVGGVVMGDVPIEQKEASPDSMPRVYGAKRCKGGGCPYTGSWLAHVNLYKRTGWYLTSTKMETASFNLFDKAKNKFQLADPADYYVHHMSMYEHLLHKAYGFEVARNKTQIMSDTAFQTECRTAAGAGAHNGGGKEKERASADSGKTAAHAAHTGGGGAGSSSASGRHHGHVDYLSLIPFYGGLPPDVTADFSKVKSIGQGNSLVPPSIKILQCMATVCSCQKYFGHVIIGVARQYDLGLVQSYINKVDSRVRHHTHVVFFNMTVPANLPFHLLAWGQQFVRKHNCQTLEGGGAGGAGGHKKVLLTHASDGSSSAAAAASDTNVFEICEDSAEYLSKLHPGAEVKVVSLLNFRAFAHVAADEASKRLLIQPSASASVDKVASAHQQQQHPHHTLTKPIRFVYYTEMDQILRFDSDQTIRAISAASNSSCFFTGRRREKDRESSPLDYMGQLTSWRECGEAGYSFTYPSDVLVRQGGV